MTGEYIAVNGMDKGELRYKYKIKRKYFQHSVRDVADGAIADCVMEAFNDYKSFFVYHSFAAEADTHALISRLIEEGKEVYLPRVEGKDMVAVRFAGGDLTENKYGIKEPQGQAYTGKIEVCIAPLLAVNSRGYRLGYGGGFYDRFFAANPEIVKAGIGYFLQYTDEFEEDGADERLDMFICERGIIYFGR